MYTHIYTHTRVNPIYIYIHIKISYLADRRADDAFRVEEEGAAASLCWLGLGWVARPKELERWSGAERWADARLILGLNVQCSASSLCSL